MNNIKKEAVVSATAMKCNTYDNGIVHYIPQVIKSRIKKISFFLWRMNYTLAEARQKHASLGHLWRQAGCCIALSMFRIGGSR